MAFSMSVNTFLLAVLAMFQPGAIALAVVPSCARVIVSVVPLMFVTRTISALAYVGLTPAGYTVALNGVAGNSDTRLAVTVNVVPDNAGDGPITTWANARFECASNAITQLVMFLELLNITRPKSALVVSIFLCGG